MKRRMIMAAALCLSLLSLCGCQEQTAENAQQQPEPTQEQTVVSAPAQSEQPDPVASEPAAEEPELPEEPIYEIPTGVWLAATDVGYSNYYYFNAEEQNGSYVSLDYGLGMPFSYEGSGKQLVFLMGDEAVAHSAVVEEHASEEFTLVWEDTLPETLTFVGEGTLDDFHFYSNDELAQMAMELYSEDVETPPSQYGAMTNEDNTVTVQLYDNLGDHNSTSAWYIVDRFTAMGTNLLTGEEIALSSEEELPVDEELPAEGEVPAQEEIPAEESVSPEENLPLDETLPVEDGQVLAAQP